MKIRSYEDLEVWQKADRLAIRVYELTDSFPKAEQYILVSQIRRAVISVPSNIVEGFNRGTKKEFISFLVIARSSLAELRYQLQFSFKRRYITGATLKSLLEEIEEIGRMINGLIVSLRHSKHR